MPSDGSLDDVAADRDGVTASNEVQPAILGTDIERVALQSQCRVQGMGLPQLFPQTSVLLDQRANLLAQAADRPSALY